MRPFTLRSGVWLALSLLLAGGTGASACTVKNEAHCGNQAGDATCAARAPGTLCNICTIDNDGCVVGPVEPACAPQSTAGSTVGTDPGTTGQDTADPTTQDPATTQGSTTQSVDDTTSVGPSSTSTDPSTTGSTGPASSSTGENLCGNGELDPGETCDGMEFAFTDCGQATRGDWNGGELSCSQSCKVSTATCCGVEGDSCIEGGSQCCDGFSCQFALEGLFTCQAS